MPYFTAHTARVHPLAEAIFGSVFGIIMVATGIAVMYSVGNPQDLNLAVNSVFDRFILGTVLVGIANIFAGVLFAGWSLLRRTK